MPSPDTLRAAIGGLARHIAILATAVLCASEVHAGGAFGPETCKQGYVWREACGPDDHVCVTPDIRTQAHDDNAQAAARREPAGGAYGRDTCKQGFVWREACGPQDHVCVAPATRDRARADDAAAGARFETNEPLWDVLTQHNDNGRSGTQPHETALTPANVRPASFGLLYERAVDGQVITQPLYVSNQWMPGHGLKNVVYVATRKNWVYAFDADDTDPDPNHGALWSVHVASDATVPGMCPETVGSVGINSTPVIDRTSDTMYLVARHADHSIWLHAMEIASGAPKAGTPGAVRIDASATDTAGGHIAFNQELELSRAALTLANGVIHMAFSALNCDNPGWRGWVLSYRAPDLAQVGAYVTLRSPGGEGAGVWQSGNGLLEDGNGHLYFLTGNANGSDGESFDKLDVGPPPFYGLTFAGSYQVSNSAALNRGDTDLASGSVILLPGGRLIGGGKQGKLYVLDRNTMKPTQNPPSGANVPGGSDGFQAFFNTWHDDATKVECPIAQILGNRCFIPHHRYEDSEVFGPNIHAGLVYWQGADTAFGTIYGMPEKDHLRAFHYVHATGQVGTSAAKVAAARSPDGMPGSSLSLSAHDHLNGILWASIPVFDGQWQNVPGEFAAFDAVTLDELWRDTERIAFPKFMPPTIAGGKVFRPTFANRLMVYGLKSAPTPPRCSTVAAKYAEYGGPDSMLGGPNGAEAANPDGIGRRQLLRFGNVGASIYWTPSTCAHVVRGPIDDRWHAIGAEAGVLGYPIDDEQATPDGIGRYNHFQHGSIYWSAFSGAHEVHGAIRDRWASLGWEKSTLGYPVSDETEAADGSGRFNVFEHGTIHWRRADGAITVNSDASFFNAVFQTGTDRPGNDIANFDLPRPDPALCQQQCSDNAACRAWTYVAPNTTQGPLPRCWLKSAPPAAQAAGCCTSGLHIPDHAAGFGPTEGAHDRLGSDFANFQPPAPDARLCEAECAATAQCKAWTYVAPNPGGGTPDGVCFLKAPAPPSTVNFCCVSGAR